MKRFHEIEGAAAIISRGGVAKQDKVYRRGADIYAATAGGFVKLGGSAGTTVPAISWFEVEGEGIEFRNGTGRPIWAAWTGSDDE